MLSLLLRLDSIQSRLGNYVAQEIEKAYDIPIRIGGLRIRHLDEITIRDLLIKSHEGDTIIHTAEGTAHISPFKAMKGEVQINTLAFVNPDIRISRKTKDEPLNIQFIIDNLGKEESSNKQNVILRINQFLAYGGKFSYDILDTDKISAAFDKNHIAIDSLGCNISIKSIDSEHADIMIRSLSGKEKSGLILKKLRVKAIATNEEIELHNMRITMSESEIAAEKLIVRADKNPYGIPAFEGNLKSNKLSINDIKPLLDNPHTSLPDIAFSITGFMNSEICKAEIISRTIDNDIFIHANANIKSIYSKTRECSLDVKEALISENGYNIFKAYIDDSTISKLELLGNSSITGNAHIVQGALRGKCHISSQAGKLNAEISVNKEREFQIIADGEDLQLERLTGIHELENCNVNARISSNSSNWGKTTEIGGSVTKLKANGYTYAPIDFTSSFDESCIKAHISTNDPNLRSTLTLSYRPKSEQRANIILRVDSIRPHKLNLLNSHDNLYSFAMNCEQNIHDDKSLTNIKIHNIIINNGHSKREIRNIHINDDKSDDKHILLLNSDIADCNVMGKFEYKTLLSSLNNIVSRHLPTGNETKGRALGSNNFSFNFNIKQTEVLNGIIDLPATIYEPSAVVGKCDEARGIFELNARINNAVIAKNQFSSIDIAGRSDNDKIEVDLQAIKPIAADNKQKQNISSKDSIAIELRSMLTKELITSDVKWNNTGKESKTQGSFNINTRIFPTKEGKPLISATISPGNITHDDSLWHVSAGRISGNSDKIEIEGINLYNSNQSIRIHGTAGKGTNDILHIETSNIEIANIFNIIKFDKLSLKGNATGKAYITRALDNPDISGNFDISRFHINATPMGSAKAHIGWGGRAKSILLDTSINEADGTTRVNGFLSQANDTIELKIAANNLSAGFLNKYLKSFLTDIDGKCNGDVFLRGSWRQIDLYGALSLDCTTHVNATSTAYTLTEDSVRFTSGAITFSNAQLTDKYGNRGTMTGSVMHRKLSDWTCDLSFTTGNMLIYDTYDFSDMPFYGTVHATGTARLTSNDEGLFLRANLENEANSRIVYNSGETGSVRDNSFITFTDSKKRENLHRGYDTEKEKDANSFLKRLNLDFSIDINERMLLKVYTNMQSEDYIDLYGNGPIQAIYDEHEGFSMKGNLNLERGTYKFTVQDIFPKEFNIIKGSTLKFNGNPFNASLDLRTKYLVPSASLSDLVPDVTRRKSVKVNCLMNINGTLQSPSLSFGLELPEGNEEEKEILASAISTPEQRNMQFIYLLGIGKFYTYDYNSTQTENTQSSTAMESFISNTLSGQLNNMLGQIIDNSNWDISGNFSTSEKGWNSMEVEGMLAGRLLNNRLLINGNFGYRENPIASSSFVGDFEMQWLMNPKGTISLKAYSKTNDRYFSKTNLTTQGAGIILRHDFNKWRWWGNKNKEERKDKNRNAKKGNKKTATGSKGNDNGQSIYILK